MPRDTAALAWQQTGNRNLHSLAHQRTLDIRYLPTTFIYLNNQDRYQISRVSRDEEEISP